MMIPLHRVFMAPDAGEAVADVLHSGYVGEGQVVRDFEEALGAYFGLHPGRMVTVNSATSGLTLAIHLLGLAPGEVLTTPLTCMATTAAIVNNGHAPVWVDVESATLNMDLDDLEGKITPRTSCIMAVHYAGRSLNLDRLYAVAGAHGLPVIEDCAHALGTTWRGRQVGTWGCPAVFSFQAIKPLTTVDGGLLIPADPNRARRLRWYGIDRDDRDRPIPEVGFKYHMNDVNAAVGLANLPFLGPILARHREVAATYRATLAPGGWLATGCDPGGASSEYLYPILVDRRQDFERAMRGRGVETGPVHLRNDLAACFTGLRNETPCLDRIHDQITCLPVGWWVDEELLARVTSAFGKGW